MDGIPMHNLLEKLPFISDIKYIGNGQVEFEIVFSSIDSDVYRYARHSSVGKVLLSSMPGLGPNSMKRLLRDSMEGKVPRLIEIANYVIEEAWDHAGGKHVKNVFVLRCHRKEFKKVIKTIKEYIGIDSEDEASSSLLKRNPVAISALMNTIISEEKHAT